MTRCAACSTEVEDGSHFCPSCGNPLETLTSAPTETHLAGSDATSSHPSLDKARFIPGTVLAERYRIVALLGRGGMGEVYRAEDLKLGQTVAMKFLPRAVEQQPGKLERFLGEIKIARTVSHPNVCRVHDVGEVDGQHFLTMEYVDGENLASLLRQVGRLPPDKAVQLARQLCAGLSAAHEQGILHRDLKPANVMIDGHGRAKIADFGLAALAGEIGDEEITAGTPAYMALEQLEGKASTARSDVYSLGLILYEVFTGKRVFEAQSVVELSRMQRDSTPPSPSMHVEGIDPAVERVILRCLEHEPSERPASARAVLAALPGGDPIAAVLAAGETPAPDLIADASESGGLSPTVGWIALTCFVVALGLLVFTSGRTQLSRMTPLPKSPEVLIRDARDLLAEMGFADEPADMGYRFYDEWQTLRALAEKQEPVEIERLLADGWPVISFMYRQSPRPMVPYDQTQIGTEWNDPPMLGPEMVLMFLRSDGSLFQVQVVPPTFDDSIGPDPEVDWTPLLDAAGVDSLSLRPTSPRRVPPVHTDDRKAWEGVLREPLGLPVRMEAGSYRGSPVWFVVYFPWHGSPAQTAARFEQGLLALIGRNATTLIELALLLLAILLARRNLRLGRGDRRTATRLALFLVLTQLFWWVFGAEHFSLRREAWLFYAILGDALLRAVRVWFFYLAVEPYFRRLWPRQLTGWIRLLDGRFRDPVVGRDVMLGTVLGVIVALIHDLYQIVPRWFGVILLPGPNDFGDPANRPYLEMISLGGLRHMMSVEFKAAGVAVGAALEVAVILLVLRLVLRKGWLACLGFTAVIIIFSLSVRAPLPVVVAAALAIATIALTVLLRYGVLCLAVVIGVSRLMSAVPVTLDLTTWYAGQTLVALLTVVALAVFGFYTSTAGRPLFGDRLLEGSGP